MAVSQADLWELAPIGLCRQEETSPVLTAVGGRLALPYLFLLKLSMSCVASSLRKMTPSGKAGSSACGWPAQA